MAAILIDEVQKASPTSTGNENITSANLGGATPVAVMVIFNHADTDATAEAHVAGGVGFTDGTRQFSSSFDSEDAQTTTDTSRNQRGDDTIRMFQGGAKIVEANFVAFIADGVTLNFTTVESSDPGLFTYVFFAGDDMSGHAGDITLSTEDSAVDETAPTFEPDLVYVMGIGSNSLTGGPVNDIRWHFGVCVNDGSNTQKGISWFSNTAVGTSDVASLLSSNRVGGNLNNASLQYAVLIDDFDANGFSATAKSGSGNNLIITYLALNFGGSASASVRSFDSPTATGNDARTGVGFKPQFVMLGMTDAQAEDVVETDADAGGIGISVFTENIEISNAWADEDAQTTSDTQSLTDNQAINFASGDGTTQHAATFVTLDDDGHTLNYATADGTARKWFEVAIGEAAAAGGLQLRRPALVYERHNLAR